MAAGDSSSPFVKAPWSKPSGRSMFGKQADSKKETAPSYSMHGSREAREKVFLSSAHLSDRRCRESPGHIYEVPGGMDKQPEARKPTAPKFTFSHTPRLKDTPSTTPGPGVYTTPVGLGQQSVSGRRSPSRVPFGSSSRDDASKLYLSSSHMGAKRGTQSAPPGQYDVPGALGPQVASSKPSSPAFSMRRTDRLKEQYDQLSKTMPSVGQYETWASIGKQTLSTSVTLPAYGFGGSTREQEGNRFLTSGHAKVQHGKYSPAHMNNQTDRNLSSFGKQSASRLASPPAYGFGSTPKMTFKSSTTPGPGSYD